MSSRSALRNRRKRSLKTYHATERRLSHQALERRELLAGDLGPQLISVSANSGENFRLAQQNILRQSPTQLTFRFDGAQQIDPATLAAITIERSGGDGSFVDNNQIRISPGFLGFGESQRIVIARFAEPLPDDTYRIRIAGFDDTNANIVGLRNVSGDLLRVPNPTDPARPEKQIQFRLELGPQVVAVVPQPIEIIGTTRVPHRDKIHVYFGQDPLSNPADGPITTGGSSATVVDPAFYNLFLTGGTVENTDDVKHNPIRVDYDPALNRAVLTFASDLSAFAPATGGSGTFRLRIGSSQPLPAAPGSVADDLTNNVGDTFQSAHDLSLVFGASNSSTVIQGEISATVNYTVIWPGAETAALSSRQREQQLIGRPDSTEGINTFFYNFASIYGRDPLGNLLENAITDVQKQRVREVLALYSQHLGVQFIESEDRGLQFVTGDLRPLVVSAITGNGQALHEYRVDDVNPGRGVLVLNAAVDWFDGYGLSPNQASNPAYFTELLRGIGSLLGIGNTFEQVPGVASGSNPALYNAAMFSLPDGTVPSPFSIEPDFLSSSDIIPGRALHRPEIRDVDMYRFDVASDGRLTIETFAQRLEETSLLDTDIKLWKYNPATGNYDLVARNDDYYSNDSFIGIDVSPNLDGTPARYVIGIKASGNDDHNPLIDGSGMGGRSQGRYEMRVSFQNKNVSTIRDVNGSALDGNKDGVPGGDFNFWFRVAPVKGTEAPGQPRTLFVDKSGINNPSAGTLAQPYRTISYAFSQARSGDIVRILPSAGNDGLIGTVADNQAFEIGRGGPSNAVLSDGETFNVPRGVTVMIDAGTIIKLRNAKISVGSSRVDEDRSLAALQVLGTPDRQVIFTSYQDESVGVDTNPLPTTPAPGQWAGIEFRNDFDFSEGRPVWESEGIFLDYVAHADIRYGGGSIAPTEPIVNPLQMLEARPTIIHNTIRFSSDAAISADPNSFKETNFHAPVYQRAASFTSDYDRVGPHIRGNRLIDNSINGLFVRVRTPAVGAREPMTVSGRFDDFDITHVISEVLVLQGQPGGPLLLQSRPDVLGVSSNDPLLGGSLPIGSTVDYRVTYVTRDGIESLASEPTMHVVGVSGSVRLLGLPQAPAEFSGRRLYRWDPATGDYDFVTQLDRNTTTYIDTGRTRGGVLSEAALATDPTRPWFDERLLPRFDARLSIDPGLVIKMDTARIETGVGADFYAEGLDGKPIVFTSRLDDQYGAGGTFDTNNDGTSGAPQPGDWAGLVFRQGSTASLDHTLVRFAGGTSAVSGGFTTFNPVEILQADVRIANSRFESNAAGYAGGLDFRDGIGFNGEATIFVRGSQPTIVNNIIRDNLGAAISINPDSLNFQQVLDRGRSTGNVDRFDGRKDNQGALISGNRLDGNSINGMLIRRESLTTESVWDDTDIVHVLEGQVYAWNHHHRGGLRLKSAPDESLVVKSLPGGGITAGRYLTDVQDAIGGTLQVIGAPGFPVVMTSIADCSVGAGFTPSGLPQNDTINSGLCSVIDVDPSAPYVDVIVVMDESASMGFVQDFSGQFILDLENGLTAAGVGVQGGNRYGAVGFGISGPGNTGRSILVGGNLFGTAAEYAAATAQFSTAGAVEDGYAGIDFALRNYTFRPEAAKFIVLATDEPRSNVDTSLTLASTLAALQATGVTVIGVLGVNIFNDANQRALAIDNREVFLETPTGFSREPGGTIRSGASLRDYVPLVTQTDGITGDLSAIGRSDVVAGKFSQVMVQSIVSSVVSSNPASPGDWQGIRIAAGANDRNVVYVLESEPAVAVAAGLNAIPATAQAVGSLATSESSADENRRLGFNIRGTLSTSGDIDVYSFFANGQTEVYLDIDDTSFGLDTVVELIDINGNILALSNSSFLEQSNSSTSLPRSSGATALPLTKTGRRTIEGPNTLDAGMRVILPGNSTTENQYFVRVRSSNLRPGDPIARLWDTNHVRAGLSSGQYLLSVRLGEADEIAGSMVRLADIRFATNAIDVTASPFNSPLSAESSERLLANGLNVNPGTNNVSFAAGDLTDLGNLLASHQGTLRVSGVLGNNVGSTSLAAAEEDLDVYRVEVRDTTRSPAITSNEPRFVSVSFDIDYADQLGGPNTRLSVYNAAGQLVAHGLNSRIADDQGRPRFNNDMTNLAAGSAGTLDAAIGPISLPEGVYFVVVSSAKMIPEPLSQLFNPSAPATGTRIIPNAAIRRIAEENFEDGFYFGTTTHVGGYTPLTGSPFASLRTGGDLPPVLPLFDDTSIVPYTLEDVRMFVTMQGGISGGNQTALLSVDPFTGQLERAIGQFGPSVGDLGIRRDGELFAYSRQSAGGAQNPGVSGNFLNVSAGNAAVLSSPDDGINFRRSNQDFNNTEVDPDAVLLVNAMSFVPPGSFAHSPTADTFPGLNGSSGSLTVVGNRSNRGRGGEVPVELQNNLVYSTLETSGSVTNFGNPDPNANRGFPANVRYIPSFGPASDRNEFGVLDLGQFLDSDPQKTGGNVTGLAQVGSTYFAVTDQGGVYRFTLGSTRTPIDPLTGTPQFAYSRVINTTFLGTVQRDPLHSPGNPNPPAFSSLTFGPQFTENGRFRNVLFATTSDGWIYTLRQGASGNVEPAGVLVHGRSAVPIMTQTGSAAVFGTVTGVAFSTREENPWHQSGRRSGSGEAHGTFPSVDLTQPRTTGGASLYFGFNNGGIVNNDGAGGNQSPGGAHGSSVSRPFSLENYGRGDAPTLYFNYFLEAESNNSSSTSPSSVNANQAVDTLRVFAVGDDGQWQLLATNNTFRSSAVTDEYDYFNDTGIPVQPLHSNTNTWRQARVDLSPLAGHKNVQLRFDFSTAGGMQSQFRTAGFLTEIQATRGVEVIPGSTFTLSRSLGTPLSNAVASPQALTTFEFVRGVAINIPAGNAVIEGQLISITGTAGPVNLTLRTVGTGDPNEVVFDRADTAGQVAQKIVDVLLALDPASTAVAVGGQVSDPEALSFTLTPERFGGLEIDIPANPQDLNGQELTITNAIGITSTVRLEMIQDLSFSVGGQTVNVTATVPGNANGVRILFRDNAALGDVAAFATFSNFQRLITVTYNSAAATITNRDFNAVVTAINNLAAFDATLAAGDGTVAFTPPTVQPVFATNEVFILASDTAGSIATKLATYINGLNLNFTATANGERLTILGVGARTMGIDFVEVSFNQAGNASQLLPSGNVPIFYHWGMSDVEVRDAIRTALVNGLGARNPISGTTASSLASYPGFATNRIRVFEQSLVSNASTLGFSTFLPGDEFGAFASSFVSGSQINPRPGINNGIEGVYIDDIIVGFAERGEFVTNAPTGNTNFVIDPKFNRTPTAEFPNEILVGGYTLNIRQSVDYAVPNDFNSNRRPPNPRSSGGVVNRRDEQFGLGRSFDTNDRFNNSVTLIAPDATEISDGDTFVISNGTRRLTFEFDTNGSVRQGNVRVPFQPNLPDGRPFPAHDVATAIRDAINSPQSRNVLGIVAAGIDGSEVGPSTANRINLFGPSVMINPSAGQFIKVDLVAAENRYGREGARTLPTVDQQNRTATNDTIGTATQIGLANPVVTQYRSGARDTLIAVGKVGDAVYTDYTNSVFNQWTFSFSDFRPQDDVDAVRIYLDAGDAIDAFAQVVGLNLGSILTPLVRIFDAETLALQQGAVDGVSGFVAPRSGFYIVAVSSAGGFGEYQLTIRPSIPTHTDAVVARYFLESSDANSPRPQGQLIIESNFISDFAGVGIRATYAGPQIPGVSTGSVLEQHPGGVALLRNPNTERLVPGTVIMNNVITASQGTGIVFSGVTPTSGSSPAPVPFGRIVNNTVVGSGGGVGVQVANSTSPTILNNVFSGFATGLSIDASSVSTITNGNAFHNNRTDSTRPIGTQSLVIPPSVRLFQDAARRLYVPAAGSAIIDSSFANLNDRATFFNTVKQPVGISASPILAPIYDAYGIPRVDDPNVTTPSGVGSNVFIDRGAIDRSDLVQPTAVLVAPFDFIQGQGVQVAGGDNDPDASFVRLPAGSGPVTFFEIQLLDPAGTGPDASTITESSVILTENGVTLTPGVDFTFGYSDNRRLIRLTPLSGVWRPDAVYEITLNNRNRVSLTLPAGDAIVDGDQYIITDNQGRQSVFEFDSGYVLQVPQTLAIDVLGPNTFFNDGDVFTIVSPQGVTRNFEINLSGAVASGNIPINLSSAGTVLEIRDAILAAISGVAGTLDLAPIPLGSGSLQIGSLFGHTLSGNVAGLRFHGVGGGVAVGDRFRYQTADNNVLFQFTDGSITLAPGAVAITIGRTDTVDQIAQRIADAVSVRSLGLDSARPVGDGRVVLGGTPQDSLDASNSRLGVIGVAGVTGPLQLQVSSLATPATLEGQTFEIQNGNTTVTFVLTTNPTLVTPNRRVVLGLTATPAQIASAIAAEIVAGFSGVLPATASGTTVTLNEQPAIIPSGTAQVRARLSSSTTLLVGSGVSGGAIAVPFIPTGMFTPAAAAAALTTVLETSPLQARTFTPGGGTLLFDNTQLIELRRPGGGVTVAGVPLPAITDLAGNTVESNRAEDETRFTITMPEVRFDFGDAPATYGTRLSDNGARHSVGANALPRLGRVIDTETDGQPFPASDDAVFPVTASSPGNSPLFSFSVLPPVGAEITISTTVTARSGDRLRIQIGDDVVTLELVAPGVPSFTGTIPVPLEPTDTPTSIAQKLADAIAAELAPTGRAVSVTVDPSDPIIRVETLDDEDGVAVGQITVGVQPYFVFLTPTADATAPIPADVLGFLNPLDPGGATVAVTVAGSGLLDAWVDFNGDGVFDATREQVLRNQAVVDGVNLLNIKTPVDAVPGTTWMRFRLSTTGNLRPNGSAVGGEVEDYQISIIPVAPFQPVNDNYATTEDITLVVTPTSPFPTLMDNDLNLIGPFLPPQVIVVDQPNNGTVTITDPFTGSFTYVPNTAFNGVDVFTYRLSSGVGGGIESPAALIATVTITVGAVNDPPVYDLRTPIDVLERDDSVLVTLQNVITNVLPGRPEATDELATQAVTITINSAASTIPANLFVSPPTIQTQLDGAGLVVGAGLQFIQRPDAFGTALIVIDVRDDHPTDPRTTTSTLTLNIRPVNDAPRLNSGLLGLTDNLGDDNAYLVADGSNPSLPAGTIVYTSAEDQPLFIPLRRPTGVIGFNRVGLLDVFTAGPANEVAPGLGANQVLELSNIPNRTLAGGTLTPVTDSLGQLTGFNYLPPRDFNSNFGGLDSFIYTVTDNNPLGGETWNLGVGGLVDDQLTTQGLVQLQINRVNDPPQFRTVTNTISVLEDSGPYRLSGFAFDIFAGPPETAFDENDPVNGQRVTFAVSGLTPQTSALFSVAPVVSPTGVLTFTPAPDAFGTAVLEVRATDDGPDNAIRGDVVSSPAQTLTINIRAVNDRPVLNTTAPLVYTMNEDGATLQPDGSVTFQGVFIPLNGSGGTVGLLDVFNPGPPNESANITPGGNQTVRLTSPIPISTAQGGTLTRVFAPGNPSLLIGLRYTPRANFNGNDSFIYGVIDNGVSVDLNGVVTNDPREAFNTVTLNVLPLNDRPQFSGALSVTVEEDATTTATVGQTVISNFVTDIAAGPPGAVDELANQTVSFIVTPMAGNPANLFAQAPAVSPNGTLTFRTAEDANGVAVFTIFAEDNGPNNPPLEFNTSTPLRTFTITVTPVNDAPTFTPVVNSFTVPEDSGPFTTTEPFATQILPGPPDEVAAGQTVRFEVTVPAAGQSLFQAQPTVTDNGFFRFTPRENAVGSTVVTVVAIDSLGARSEPALVTITITEVNDVPVAGNVTLNSSEDTLLVIPERTLLDAAVDPDLQTNPNEVLRLTSVATTSQAGAVIRLLPSGNLEYDPRGSTTLQALRPGQTLADTFTYRVVDAAGATSNLATVTINVAGVNDPPTVRDDFVTLALSGPTTIRPLNNDFDVDGTINPLSLRLTLLPAFGSVVVQPDGTLIYTPFDNFRGTDTIRYTVSDDLGAVSEQATITIDTNLPPIAVNDNAGTFRGRAVEINVASNDSDPDGTLDLNSIQIVRQPSRGSVVVMGGGLVRYVPSSDFVGIDTFDYTIRDNRGRPSNVGQVRIQVVASELQNPSNFTDVNASGETSPLDALLILNRLSRAAREGVMGGIPVESLINELPRLFYDVDGSRVVEPIDALLVINEIARQNRAALGEGEGGVGVAGPMALPPAAPPMSLQVKPADVSTLRDDFESVYGTILEADESADLTADFKLPGNDVLDLLAMDTVPKDSAEDKAEAVKAIDAAWTEAAGM